LDYQYVQEFIMGQKIHFDGSSSKTPLILILPWGATWEMYDTSTVHVRGEGTANYFATIRILGTLFDSKLSFLPDIVQKKHIMWGKFNKFRGYLTNAHFELFERMEEFIALVWKAATHHSAVWPDQNTKKLIVAYEKMMRRMLNTSMKRLNRAGTSMSQLLEREDVPTAECLLRREFLTTIRTMLKDPKGLGNFAIFGQLDLTKELQRKNKTPIWHQTGMDKKLSGVLRDLAYNIGNCTDTRVKFTVKGRVFSKKEIARISMLGALRTKVSTEGYKNQMPILRERRKIERNCVQRKPIFGIRPVSGTFENLLSQSFA